MKIDLLRQYVAQGYELPRWYGFAWRDFSRDVAVCYPIPLNVLARWGRLFWIWLRFQGMTGKTLSTLRYEAYRDGVAGRPFHG